MMKVSYEFDQDPRYGWASIDVEGKEDALIIVHGAEGGSHGFIFRGGEMIPSCFCSARNEGECACPNVEWWTHNEEPE